jgi:putative ABC transport system permease protein
VPRESARQDAYYRSNPVDAAFFETVDIPVRAGRVFGAEDRDGAPLVVVLNEAAARHFFPGVERPVGRRIALGTRESGAPLRDIVGIVGDVRQRGLADEPEPQIYVPHAQSQYEARRLNLLLELRPGTAVPTDAIRAIVRATAPEVPVDAIETLRSRVLESAAQSRFLTFLLSVMAAVGLVLAALGTFATTSYAVHRRLREVGIRLALGAASGEVFRMVVARVVRIAAAGIALGLATTLLLSRFLEGYVFGISARDPLTIAAACLVIATAAILAALAPALRAARADPTNVLRVQ